MAQINKSPARILAAFAFVVFIAVGVTCRGGPDALAIVEAVSEGGVGTFTDNRDGNTYKIVAIGNRVWMAENLKYGPGATGCYGGNESYCDEYGMLYNWHAANTSCPTGWRLPTRGDWNNLSRAVGGVWGFAPSDDEDKFFVRWGVAGAKLKAKKGWNYYRDESGNGLDDYAFSALPGNGTDDYGFSALPGGSRKINGMFIDGGENGYWWTSNRTSDNFAYARSIHLHDDVIAERELNASLWLSVRCVAAASIDKKVWDAYKLKTDDENVKAAEEEAGAVERRRQAIEKKSSYFTDSRDGRKYRSVTIGGRVWMAEDLKYLPPEGNWWCYANDSSKCDKYGRLYDWGTVKKVCPAGWRLPSVEDWDSLSVAAGGDSTAGKSLKSTDDVWRHDGGGTDDYGFSAVPGGFRYSKDDIDRFANFGLLGNWWTSAVDEDDDVRIRALAYNKDKLLNGAAEKDAGLPVRCVENRR